MKNNTLTESNEKPYGKPIARRAVSDLSVGDVLRRNSDNRYYKIFDIDKSLTTTHIFYHFNGFTVKSNNLLRKMFKSNIDGSVYIYESEFINILERIENDTK